MNNPEYIPVDIFSEIVANVQTALVLETLNYQYGYITELNETLQSWNKTPEFASKRFPLVYLVQPFPITRGLSGFYGKAVFNLFVINTTTKIKKAADRMTDNFKPVIYPIYRELLNQIDLHEAFSTQGVPSIVHNFTDNYYWGEKQQSVLNDIVDCSQISGLTLMINNNSNCKPTKSF